MRESVVNTRVWGQFFPGGLAGGRASVEKPMNSGLKQEEGFQGGRKGTEVGQAEVGPHPSLPTTKSCPSDTFPFDIGSNKCLEQKVQHMQKRINRKKL